MSNLMKIIKERRSIRIFKPEEVPPDLIKEMIDAARWAPSACNKQAWEFIVVVDPEIKKKLIRDPPPVVIYIIYDKRINPANYANIQSASAAIQNALLRGHELGLGCCWISAVGNKDKVRTVLGIPKTKEVVAGILVGYPDESPTPPIRRDLEDVIHLNKYESRIPETPDLDDWGIKEIREFASRSIRSTSPRIGGASPYPIEESELVQILEKKIPEDGEILCWFSYPGNLLFHLAKKQPYRRFVSIEFSEEIIEWMKLRQFSLGIENVDYTMNTGDLDDVGINIMYETPNKIPNYEAILENARDNAPKTLLIVANMISFHGLYYRKTKYKIIPHFGPYKPQNILRIKKTVQKIGFRIIDDVGLDLIPSPKKINNVVGNRYVTVLLNRINSDLLEGYSTQSFLKGICRLRVLELEVKNG